MSAENQARTLSVNKNSWMKFNYVRSGRVVCKVLWVTSEVIHIHWQILKHLIMINSGDQLRYQPYFIKNFIQEPENYVYALNERAGCQWTVLHVQSYTWKITLKHNEIKNCTANKYIYHRVAIGNNEPLCKERVLGWKSTLFYLFSISFPSAGS